MSSKPSSPKSSPKTAPKAKKTEVMNTGVKVDGKTVYFTKGLKNPLSGFFFKSAGGKKNKVLVKNVANEKTKSALENVLKKHSNAVAPPAGKVLNPLTGRYVKAPAAKKEKKVAKKSPTPKKSPNSNNDNNNDRDIREWRHIEGRTSKKEFHFDTPEELDDFLNPGELTMFMEEAGVETMNVTITISKYPNVKITLVLYAKLWYNRELIYGYRDIVVVINGKQKRIDGDVDDVIKFLKELDNPSKKSSNVVAPPAGKVLNPLTGRFVKAPAAKKEKKVAKKVPSSAWKFGSLLEFIAFVETDDLLYAMQDRDVQSLERDIDIKGYPNVKIHISARRGHVNGGRNDNIIHDSVTITKGGVTKEFSRIDNVSMRAFIENPTG
jgi:hypothetical protein